MAYSAVLFAPDGDWTCDYHCDTIEQVQDRRRSMSALADIIIAGAATIIGIRHITPKGKGK